MYDLRREGELDLLLFEPPIDLQVDSLLNVHVRRVRGTQDVVDGVDVQGIRPELPEVGSVEANALLRDLVNENAMGFMLTKLGIVGLGSLLLWRNRRRPLAVVSIFVAFLAYYLVLVYHIEYSSFIVRAMVKTDSLPVFFD